jgi:hypothetical protein
MNIRSFMKIINESFGDVPNPNDQWSDEYITLVNATAYRESMFLDFKDHSIAEQFFQLCQKFRLTGYNNGPNCGWEECSEIDYPGEGSNGVITQGLLDNLEQELLTAKTPNEINQIFDKFEDNYLYFAMDDEF